MEPVFGILLVIIGVAVVCVGMARDLRTCHTTEQRGTLWVWTLCLVAAAIITAILLYLLPSWLSWLVCILFLFGLLQSVRWLQTVLVR